MKYIEPKYNVPFHLMKRILYIQDSEYKYTIDENGYGHAMIDGAMLCFFMNEYAEIVPETICFENL